MVTIEIDGDEGSSPLARGAHLVVHTLEHLLGIIPACAGSTPVVSSYSTFWMRIIPACAGSTR